MLPINTAELLQCDGQTGGEETGSLEAIGRPGAWGLLWAVNLLNLAADELAAPPSEVA